MHERLCLISALSPSGGPRGLLEKEDVEEISHHMALEMTVGGRPGAASLDIADIEEIVRGALLSTNPNSAENEQEWQPEGFLDKGFNDCQYFTACIILTQSGDDSVDLRRVQYYDPEPCAWRAVIYLGPSGDPVLQYEISEVGTEDGDPFFCWEGPYRYLEAWISRDSPFSFAQTFFKLVNLHRGPAVTPTGDYVSGLLPCIAYGGLENTYENGFQDDLGHARAGSKHTADAIVAGKRGPELWSALAYDFGAWMAVRPDIWPTPPTQSQVPLLSVVSCEAIATPFDTVPTELLLQILCQIPISSLLSLCATSRSTCNLIFPLLDDVLWYQVHHGDLFWLLPVPTVIGEVQRADDVASLWYRRDSDIISVDRRSPFDTPRFPYFQFVRVCLSSSFSMLNRRRLWNVCMQYERLGRDSGIW